MLQVGGEICKVKENGIIPYLKIILIRRVRIKIFSSSFFLRYFYRKAENTD